MNAGLLLKENYLNFIRELSSEKKFSWLNILFIDSALAAEITNNKEAALVSLTNVTPALYSGVEIVGTCIPGRLISAVGQISQVIKSVVHPNTTKPWPMRSNNTTVKSPNVLSPSQWPKSHKS